MNPTWYLAAFLPLICLVITLCHLSQSLSSQVWTKDNHGEVLVVTDIRPRSQTIVLIMYFNLYKTSRDSSNLLKTGNFKSTYDKITVQKMWESLLETTWNGLYIPTIKPKVACCLLPAQMLLNTVGRDVLLKATISSMSYYECFHSVISYRI